MFRAVNFVPYPNFQHSVSLSHNIFAGGFGLGLSGLSSLFISIPFSVNVKPLPIVRLLTLALPSTVIFFFTVAFSFTIAFLVTLMFPVTDISFWTVIDPLIFALPFTSSSALGSSFLIAIPTNPSAVTHTPGCDLEPIFQRSEP